MRVRPLGPFEPLVRVVHGAPTVLIKSVLFKCGGYVPGSEALLGGVRDQILVPSASADARG